MKQCLANQSRNVRLAKVLSNSVYRPVKTNDRAIEIRSLYEIVENKFNRKRSYTLSAMYRLTKHMVAV
jgi:hypothetical protein